MSETRFGGVNVAGVAVGCLAAVVIAGVLFALSTGALFYFGFVQRGVYDSLRVQLAQSTLNQLVPYVELYRTEHATYPDTIEQVSEVIPPNTPVFVYDPSAPPTGPQRQLYYERVGTDHYILRSVGADGAPFTADDIVPQGFQGRRTGLLIARPAPAAAPLAPNSDNLR